MQWWPRKQSFYLVEPLCSVQGWFHLPKQLTINVLGQLTAILCAAWSRKAIPHRSCLVFSPDNVFMVLVSIFISNHDHFCVLCFRLAAARGHRFMTYWNIEHNSLKTYIRTDGRTDGRTTPSLCLGTPVPRQKPSWLLHVLPYCPAYMPPVLQP